MTESDVTIGEVRLRLPTDQRGAQRKAKRCCGLGLKTPKASVLHTASYRSAQLNPRNRDRVKFKISTHRGGVIGQPIGQLSLRIILILILKTEQIILIFILKTEQIILILEARQVVAIIAVIAVKGRKVEVCFSRHVKGKSVIDVSVGQLSVGLPDFVPAKPEIDADAIFMAGVEFSFVFNDAVRH